MNATNNGNTTSAVPAAMSPQSDAPSPAVVNIASPIVTVLLSGELVTIRGHKNSFQWKVTLTMLNATRTGRTSGTSTYQTS